MRCPGAEAIGGGPLEDGRGIEARGLDVGRTARGPDGARKRMSLTSAILSRPSRETRGAFGTAVVGPCPGVGIFFVISAFATEGPTP